MPDVNLPDKVELIKKQKCFSRLNEKEYEILGDLLKEKHIKAGETIVEEGDVVDTVFLIVDGKADVRHVYLKDGKKVFDSIAELGPDQAIGLNETGFYSVSGIRTATVVALTDMIVFQLSVAAFHGFALAYPHVNEVMRHEAKKYIEQDKN